MFQKLVKWTMGNESSLINFRRGSKDRDAQIVIDCVEDYIEVPIYRKKSNRSVSRQRLDHGSSPLKKASLDSGSLSSRKSSVSSPRGLSSDGSGDSLLSPLTLVYDRRRSRSLCSAQMKDDVQAVTSPSKDKEEKLSSRKSSSGLVPSLNRLRIQQCYRGAKPSIGESIMKRAAASRPEMRAFLSKMNDQQMEFMQRDMYELITDAVENADKSDKVLAHARQFGDTYASLCPLGFRPDLFSTIADAAIAECVKLDSGVHKRCETLSAWSQLFSALFSAVRDGYYQRIRQQRRTSVPHNPISKQLSVDFSPKGIERRDAVVR
ncbi:unnamed protein product [Caenorhabditis auriculariae]|uniref:Globin domain-containing protein n=1 Tax=Caenorhabditis auriculariae TaxID=2777116 RepID=A0A8S1GYG0_9PELO|nr:unnamed protein product [Caenorhabditis auriculariae]